MIKNIKCKQMHNTLNKPIFRFRWEWIYNSGDTLPFVKLFYCPIEENEIFRYSLFSKDSIISYMFKDVPERHVDSLLSNNRQYKTMLYKLSPNGSIYFEGEIEIDHYDCIYSFYLVDDTGVIFDSFAKKTLIDSDVEYSVVKARNGRNKLIIENNESRRIVLQTIYKGREIYSLIAIGHKELYIDAGITDFKLKYLTDLIAF